MNKSFYVANTYLKVLTRSNDGLLTSLLKAMGPSGMTLLEDDYIYNADIERIFSQFAEHGLDSWLLRYGKDLSIASHGPVGFAVLSAPNLKMAMQVLSDYSVIRSSAYQLDFIQGETRAKCVLIDKTDGGLTGRWLAETGIRIAQQLIENVLAHPLGNNTTISFAHPEPAYKNELNALFGVTCEFGAEQNSISFPASWCQVSSPLSDQETHKTNLAKCHELKLALGGYKHLGETVAMALQNYFESRAQGRVTNKELPTLESLAKQHNVSSRTLNRKLKEQNTSYKSLLIDARKAQACYLLKNTYQTIADIAYNLAYQEPANFVRAFKMWFDVTPGTWRRQQATMLNREENRNER